MREGGHFSLFIMTKILRKQFKNLINTIMKILWMLKNPCGVNWHIMKFCGTCKKHAGRNGNLIIYFAWPHYQFCQNDMVVQKDRPATCKSTTLHISTHKNNNTIQWIRQKTKLLTKKNQKRYRHKTKRNTDGFFNCKMVYVIELQRNGLFTKKENWYELMVDVTGWIQVENEIMLNFQINGNVHERWRISVL